MKNIFLAMLILLLGSQLQAQNENGNLGSVIMYNVHYGFQTPGGDLADRFGRNGAAGLGIDFLTKKNFIFGITGDYQFGTAVREDVVDNLRDNGGNIIGRDLGIASLVLRRRGIYVGATVGKLLPLSKKSRSGIRLTLGTGFWQHKIRVQDDLSSVPQIEGDYIKGYDRLTNGLALTQFVGYQLMTNNRRVNMYIGIEATQGFTQNRRAFNFNTMQRDDSKRLDTLFALKIGWTIVPTFLNEETGDIYY